MKKKFNDKFKGETNFVQELQNDFGASDYDMMMIFGTSASEQRQYLKDNPNFNGIVEPMEGYVTTKISRRNF